MGRWITVEQMEAASEKGVYTGSRTTPFWGRFCDWLWDVEFRNTTRRSFLATSRWEWSKYTVKILLAESAREITALVVGYYAMGPKGKES